MKKHRGEDETYAFYSDDLTPADETSTSYRNRIKLIATLLVIPGLFLGNTLAANINLVGDQALEFGQGVVLSTSCDSQVLLTPRTTFTQENGNSEHRLSGVVLSQIDGTVKENAGDEGCRGKFFTIKAYTNSSSTPIITFQLSINLDGGLISGDARTVATGEGTSSSAVTLLFDDPAVSSSNIYRFTMESMESVYTLNQITNPANGQLISGFEKSRNDILFVMTVVLDSNQDVVQSSLYRSIDLGVTWTLQGNMPEFLWNITSSSDGNRLVGANWGGHIFTSNDSGVTWTDRGNANAWWHLSSSGSGQIVAGVTEKIGFRLSRDYGVTWSSPLPNPRGTYVQSAISEDGTKILVSESEGRLQYSSDSGNSWSLVGDERNWSAVAMSADGSHMYATEFTDIDRVNGRIYTSKDGGLTWLGSSINNNWWKIETSHDGRTVAASPADKIDSLFISNDFGATWRRSNAKYYFDSVGVSQTGNLVFSIASNTVFGTLDIFKTLNPRN